MTKRDGYRTTLRALDRWDAFLLRESGLPGPRGNLELAQAVADEGTKELFDRLAGYSANEAPTNSPHEFLAFCGVLGFGRLLGEGHLGYFEVLRSHASDPRWRIREAVAMALQRFGTTDMQTLVREMTRWSRGSPMEQRAAVAALCEPKLLGPDAPAGRIFAVLDHVTSSLADAWDPRDEGCKALRKGLAYCWSVAVAAYPAEGKEAIENWLAVNDRTVAWIMRQNLKKKRLARMDQEWVARWLAQLDGS